MMNEVHRLADKVIEGFNLGAFMDYNSLIGPAVVAAIVSGFVTVIGFFVNRSTLLAMHSQRLDFDRQQAERRVDAELGLAERKFVFDKELATHQLDAQIALAEKRFRFDVALSDRKRRQELAEEVLSGFYQARNIIQAIRSPMSFGTEAAGRPRADYESEAQARGRDTYFVQLARLKEHSEFLSSLMSKRYRAEAWFGADIGKAFQALHEVLVSVRVSADMLFQMSGEGLDPTTRRNFEKDIWRTDPANDPLDQKVEDAIKTVETLCWPVLRATD
jgi:hypothetical protein